MTTAIETLKARARILHRRAQDGDPVALARVRGLPELRALDPATTTSALRRRHCLALMAREFGFRGWPHAVAVLGGEPVDDFGTLLYPDGAEAHWNIWCASHDEAKAIHAGHGGYLLAYRRDCFIVDEHFIATIGLDAGDPDWQRLGRDWVRPPSVEARNRLYAQLIDRRPL